MKSKTITLEIADPDQIGQSLQTVQDIIDRKPMQMRQYRFLPDCSGADV